MSKPTGWKRLTDDLPPLGVVVETKIHDDAGQRMVQPLKWSGVLWFVPDGSIYVYYSPTHWRALPSPSVP